MTMKAPFALYLVLVSMFAACKKEVVVLTPAPVPSKTVAATPPPAHPAPSNPYNDIAETKSPVLTPVTVSVNGNIGGYQHALPHLYDSTTKKYPLLVFLHGIGELGNGSSDLWLPARLGPAGLIKSYQFPPDFTVNGQHFSFIVIAPQFKAWPSPSDINDMISYAISKYRIDTTRIYLSGLSMGGGATWEYGAAYGKRLAALAPICGASSPTDDKAQKIASYKLPVWAFHNDDDYTVSSSNSKNWVTKIDASNPAIPAKLTLWPSGGHDAWTKATDPKYKENGMNVYEWMLQYQRN